MSFSLLFTRMNGSVALLKASFGDDGLLSYWESTTLTGAPVQLSPGDKWVAIAALHHEAKRLAAVAS